MAFRRVTGQNPARMRGRGFVRRLLRLGSKMAMMAALVPALGLVNGGCLALSEPDFRGQDECVPFFLTLGADPPLLNRTPIEKAEFSGSVQMRTCALTKDYVAHVFLDGVPVLFTSVPPTGVELRTVPVLVDISRSSPGCHIVELYVSSKFKDGTDFTKPERRDDIAYILWTFVNSSDATVASCGVK